MYPSIYEIRNEERNVFGNTLQKSALKRAK
jgi:hypothetical protein